MKKLLFLFLTLGAFSVNAQDIKVPSSLVVMEGTYKLDGVDRNGFDIVLQGDEKAINSAWVKYIDDKFDLKLKAKGATASGEEFLNTVWSDKQFMLKSAVIKDGSGPHLRVWMMFGADILVSSSQYGSEAANVKAVMKEFSKAYYVGVFQKQLDSQTKEVESQGKEVSSINADQAKIDKAIAKENKAIAKAESKMAKYKSKIESYQSKIVSAENDIKDAKQTIEKKNNDSGKKATDLVKEKEKLENENASNEAIKAKIKAIQAL